MRQVHLPDRAVDASPFEHIPPLPAMRDPGVAAPILLTTVAAALTTLGLAGFRRRATSARSCGRHR
ncbi:hypothetical protein [Streptomyces adonidis]|uniref:hypothetical protein n=1 Tax=Streptomyces adonidis TaxID=3231367 RepID=UPI0034DB2330